VTPATILVAVLFALLGAGAERLASVWPADEARRMRAGPRTVALAAAAAAAGGLVAWRSALPAWATVIYLLLLVPMVVLTATDLEQRRLPHLALDPLILGALAFVPFNPAVQPVSALVGSAALVGFLGVVGLLVRGGIALGDLYLVVPIGLLTGFPGAFLAVFAGALLSAVVSIGLIVTRRAGLGSYIPFGPFLVAGFVVALVQDPSLLQAVASLARG
jgi:leader peptidase (prepilin peptidase)/N-methyltransferase